MGKAGRACPIWEGTRERGSEQRQGQGRKVGFCIAGSGSRQRRIAAEIIVSELLGLIGLGPGQKNVPAVTDLNTREECPHH